MKIRFYRFTLPMVESLDLSQDRELHERSGFLLRIGSAWAEASPLPGFSKEGDEEVLADFQRILDEEDPKTPSVRFAMYCLRELPDEGVDCAVSALLTGSPRDMLDRATELAGSKCTAAKIKVGSRPIDEDAEIVRAISEALGDAISLRLDANRQWTADQAMVFSDLTQDLTFEYIEEPAVSEFDLADIRLKSKWRTAYDETLQDRGGVVTILETATSDMLIDKPSLTGGLQFKDIVGTPKVTYSAAFESGIGLYRIAQLASKGDRPAGLDTYRWLAEDVLKRRLNLSKWRLKLKRMPPVDVSRLEEIEL